MATKNDLRRRQLVVPFGTGGTYDYLNFPAITTSVDYWNLDLEKQELLEIKNQRFIHYINKILRTKYEGPESKRVTRLVQPPIAWDSYADTETKKMMGPVEVRKFPLWGVCTSCSALAKCDPYNNNHQRCQNRNSFPGSNRQPCIEKSIKPHVEPIRFIAFCSRGHIQDLPWDELMSSQCKASCNMANEPHNFSSPSLYLTDDGNGMGFNSLKITCGSCEERYSLRALGNSELYQELSTKAGMRMFSCAGKRPWAEDENMNCDQMLQIQPRGASCVYLPIQRSSIYVPEKDEVRHPVLDDEAIINIIENEPGEESLRGVLEMTKLYDKYSLRIDEAVEIILEELKESGTDELEEEEEIEQEFLLKEYETLCLKEVNDPSFKSLEMNIDEYSLEIKELFTSLHQVTKVKSSTALLGFERSSWSGESNAQGLPEKDTFNPSRINVPFMPAFEVSGEGFFLNFGYKK